MAGSAVAIPILAVQQMNDVGIGGALVAVSLGPSVLAAPLAGAALDRAGRPAVLVAVSGVLTALAFAATAFLGRLPLPLVFACLAVAGAASPFYMGGLSSFVADVIPDGRRAFAYDALSYNVSAVAGPAFVAIMAVVTAASTLSQLGQGGLAIAAVALSIERIGSPADGALVVTSFAVGSLVGALRETVRPTRARPHAVMMAGFLATGLLTVGAAVDIGTAWTVVAIGLSGVFTASTAAAMLFLRNHLSPPHLRSQIFTVGAGLRASASAGGAALAASATGLGGALSLAVVGIVWVTSAALMAAYPKAGQAGA